MTFNPAKKVKKLVFKLMRPADPKVAKVSRQINSRSDLVFQCHRMEARPARLSVPIEKVRIQGAIPFNANHPFVKAINDGPDTLRRFYEEFKPTDLGDMYYLAERGLKGADLPPWEIPWMACDVRKPPPGEAGLHASHGVSFYGPATPEKVAVEMKRLTSVRDSIEKNGYIPDLHGDIEGYGLISETDYRFFVRGGKHRLAVLASLGWTDIPVSFRGHWPTAVFSASLNDWPLVANGALAPQTARAVFNRYFDV